MLYYILPCIIKDFIKYLLKISYAKYMLLIANQREFIKTDPRVTEKFGHYVKWSLTTAPTLPHIHQILDPSQHNS